MADIATLGIEVKTTGLDEATDELTKLSGAAARAEAAVEDFEIASQGATGAAVASAAAYNQQSAAAGAAAKSTATLASTTNESAGSLQASKSDIAGLSDILKDMGVSAVSSVSPFQVALQQGVAMAKILGPLGASGSVNALGQAFKSIGSSILSFLSPVSLMTIAMVGLTTGFLQLTDWSKLAATALDSLDEALLAIAPYVLIAAAALAFLYGPALIGGLIGVIAVLGQMAAAGLVVAASFTGAWLAALGPIGWLILGLAAVVSAAMLFGDKLTEILGVDIVATAKDGANFLIGCFVAAYEDIKFLWNQFPNIIGAAAIGAANLAINAIGGMIQKAADYIDSIAKKANEWLPKDYQIGTIGNLGLEKDAFDNPYAAKLEKAMADRNAKMKEIFSTSYIDGMASGVAKATSFVADGIKDLANGIMKVDDAQKKTQTTAAKTTAVTQTQAASYDDLVESANKRLASLQAEQAAVGLSAEAAARLKYETELLNEAQQKNIALSPEQRANLMSLAAQMAATDVATANSKAALELAKSSATGFLSTMRQGLVDGEGWWKTFGNAVMGVLDKITSAIETQLVNALFSTGGGGFNFLSLFGLGGGLVGGASSDPWSGMRTITPIGGAPAAQQAAKVAANQNVRRAQASQGVHVTVGLVKNGLNIQPEVVEIARNEAGQAAGRVKQGFDGWRTNGMKRDVEDHLKNRRKIG